MEDHIFYTFEIKSDLSAKITFNLDETEEDLVFIQEKAEKNNFVFDGYYTGNDGTRNYFLLDGDRIIILEFYGDSLILAILIREKRTE
jgi:hypothetical protein